MIIAENNAAPWRTAGLIWKQDATYWEWLTPSGADRQLRRLDPGDSLSFAFGADRRCIGLWSGGRRRPCPETAVLRPDRRSAQCELCAAAERSSSIATDTRLEDPRPFAVYLAYHGRTIKVGITAAERGTNRLLEQGALASVFLSTGPLMAARRAEHLLGTALGIPDRVSAQAKRAARARPGSVADRAATLWDTATRARALPGWPAAQQPSPEVEVLDHAAAYGLPDEGLAPDAVLGPPYPGEVVTGRIACRIGDDLYLRTPSGLLLLVDTHLLAGWALDRAAPDEAFTAGVRPIRTAYEPDALF